MLGFKVESATPCPSGNSETGAKIVCKNDPCAVRPVEKAQNGNGFRLQIVGKNRGSSWRRLGAAQAGGRGMMVGTAERPGAPAERIMTMGMPLVLREMHFNSIVGFNEAQAGRPHSPPGGFRSPGISAASP
jgi:hypothetical protein